MSLNPEFQRNLWLQISAQRLIAAPVVIGLAVLLAHLADASREEMADIARIAYYVIVAGWGTRRAADAVAEEVVGGTWDGQRMSALGAWSMSWGKLLGSTIYVWYCAGLCLLVYVYGLAPDGPLGVGFASMPVREVLFDLAMLIGIGLLGQAVAMVVCLAILGRGAQGRRLPVTVSQLIGLLVVVLVPFGESLDPVVVAMQTRVTWYGFPAQTATFALLSLAAFLAWALIGVYRLMRIELQFRSYPFVWLLLTSFLVFYVEGFLYDSLSEPDVPLAAWLVVPAAITAALTYLVLFLQPKDIVRYRWLAGAARSGDLQRALSLMPLWLPTFVLTIALVILFVVLDTGRDWRLPYGFDDMPALVGVGLRQGGWAVALAMLLFMTRDIALVLFLNFNSRRRRADVAAFIYLVVLYVPLPVIASLLGGSPLLSLFVPVPWISPAIMIPPPLVEAAVMLALLAWRMAAARPMIAKPA